ncbi:hypothetical protein D3C87_1870590 [compost metagenome]
MLSLSVTVRLSAPWPLLDRTPLRARKLKRLPVTTMSSPEMKADAVCWPPIFESNSIALTRGLRLAFLVLLGTGRVNRASCSARRDSVISCIRRSRMRR